MIIRFLFLCVMCGLHMIVLAGCVSGSPKLTVRDSRVVGNELRLTVETSVSHSTFTSHGSTVSDVASYCVLVDLKSSTPLAHRSRVIGPLYNYTAERSDMAYNGVDFTERDRQARAATPRIFFDDLGELVRLKAAGARYQREQLDFASRPPRWQAVDMQSLPALSLWRTIFSSSGRWAMDYELDVPHLYDMRTGEQKADPWLEAAFIDYRSRARTNGTLANARLWLNDDLTHLVVTPLAGFVARDGTPSTFENVGRQFNADDYALDYVRPDSQSRVVPTHFGMDGGTHALAGGLFMINGEPLLLHGASGTANLSKLNGETAFHSPRLTDIPGRIRSSKGRNSRLSDEEFEKLASVYHFQKIFDQPESKRLVFLEYDPKEFTPYINFVWGSVDVIAWYYQEGRIEYQRLNLKDVFSSRSGRYHASNAEDIAE
ncbi:MAG: hypothetical protein JWM68_5758 [Verrucomicrobiales bacterium]|nr:hypothetical protein [Verrucomicrobiales bacterium]